jgi:hypothetical protein
MYFYLPNIIDSVYIQLWEPSMGTSHRLPIRVSKQQLDKHNYRGN